LLQSISECQHPPLATSHPSTVHALLSSQFTGVVLQREPNGSVPLHTTALHASLGHVLLFGTLRQPNPGWQLSSVHVLLSSQKLVG